MRPRRQLSWILLLVPACTDRLAVATASESAGSTTTEPGPTTTSPTTTSPTTSASATTDAPGTTDADSTTGSTSHSTSASTAGTTGSSSEDTSDSTTAAPSVCGPPCAATWTHHGDLVLSEPKSTAEFECMDTVTGKLQISGDVDVAALSGLRNLRFTERLRIEFGDKLVDLSPFDCLEEATDGLTLIQVPALADASALGKLRAAAFVTLEQTGLTAAPTFAPDFTGVSNVYFRANPVLTDLGAMAGWGHLAGESLAIQIDDNPALTSLVGIDGPIAAAGDTTVAVQVTKAPKLASLAGLEPMTHGSLWLQALPLVPDLLPLTALTEGDNLTLFGMPAVKTLQGLHNLATADMLMIGDCVSGEAGTPGMDGLVDLSGLDVLTSPWSLSIANNANLASLAGAPLLTKVGGLEVIANPKLTKAKVDEFLMQLEGMPEQCVGGFDQCTCFDVVPW